MSLLLRLNISYFIYIYTLNLGLINFEINENAKSMFKKNLEENQRKKSKKQEKKESFRNK